MGTRRRILLGTLGAAGALVVGWGVLPPRQRLTPSEPLPAVAGQLALNGWVRIGSDDTVTVVVPKSEMGQGVHTAAAMLLAEELDADFTRVQVEQAPVDPIYNNVATVVDGLPFHPDNQGAVRKLAGWLTAKTMREFGLMLTGGSSSVKDLWLPMREAGAAARAMLVAAAAARWSVPAAELRVEAGQVTHPATGRSVRFGELAPAASALPMPRDVPLKSREQFKLIGKDTPRLEARTKGEGRAGFGIDVVLPGMLYATVKMCRTLGGKVASLAGAKAMALPGVKSVFAVEGHHGGTAGVAVIADTPWHALKAIEAVEVTWDEAVAAAGVDSDAARATLVKRLDGGGGFAWFSAGDAEAALAGAAQTVKADYTAPWLAHAAMEPINCTVQFKDGRATVWASTQAPDLARMVAANALGLRDASKVEVKVQLLGGGFGRRLDVDFIAQAAAIARKAPGGAPVQTFWTRAEDTTHDFYRPACAARFTAGFDATGRLLAVTSLSAGQALVPQVVKRLFDVPVANFDKTVSEGASDQPYEWPAARIAHAVVELPVPAGFWRSVGHSHQAFFMESFVDEMAAAAKADPVAFRLSLLQRHPRHANVLRLAAEKAGWGTPAAAAADGAKVTRGVALHESFGTIVAQVAEVSIATAKEANKAIRVHRVVCAVDCGLAVNPNHVRQQMDSAVVFGLSAALHGAIDIVKGRVTQTNYHDYPVLRLDACPVIETHIVASDAHPEGIGEPGTPPIAPAVANALFALTGQRLRSLPLKLA
ncbi:MAG: xanthine dehydrogenase family protein molybdopterin-binding subunit [Burkholderiales bacterium]|nr:xanthine dehydrogenase family protein molybdopterin-binding subunit [Burkholderiales bacterium]